MDVSVIVLFKNVQMGKFFIIPSKSCVKALPIRLTQ